MLDASVILITLFLFIIVFLKPPFKGLQKVEGNFLTHHRNSKSKIRNFFLCQNNLPTHAHKNEASRGDLPDCCSLYPHRSPRVRSDRNLPLLYPGIFFLTTFSPYPNSQFSLFWFPRHFPHPFFFLSISFSFSANFTLPLFGLDSLYLPRGLIGLVWFVRLCFYTRKWCHHEDFGLVCVCFLQLGVVLMASAQVLPNSMASTRKLEHLEAGKRRVPIFLPFLLVHFFAFI